MTYTYRIGADENGLGARLGPLVVTAVLARLNETGRKQVDHRLPKRLREDLDDSKRLVSHKDVALGEAWARALVAGDPRSPRELLQQICLDGEATLTAPCPKHVEAQCWACGKEAFSADENQVGRMRRHRVALARRGIEIIEVKSIVVCTRRLNQAKKQGQNRFISDLHAMERLAISLKQRAGQNLLAVCGKVGGMNEYSKFFGPLSGFLHAVIEQGKNRSSYHFPQLGELRFVKDADASDPLVMLASLVGKYLRELLMARIDQFYERPEHLPAPSGYHDGVTARFVARTQNQRRKRRIPVTCFERQSEA